MSSLCLIRRLLPLLAIFATLGALRPEMAAAADVVITRTLTTHTWPERLDYKFKRGDDPRWAQPDFDDRDWASTRLRDLPSRDGIYWVRFKVTRREAVNQSSRRNFVAPGELPAAVVFSLRQTLSKWVAFGPEELRDGMAVSAVASYELFWDGRLIGRNGRPGMTPEDERAGYVDNLFQIPAGLTEPGEHTVALRLSSHETGFPSEVYALLFNMGNFRELLVTRMRQALFSVVTFGGAFVLGVLTGLTWLLADRSRAWLWMSASCFVAATMQVLQAWRWLFEYPYPWHYPRLVSITLLSGALGLLLVAFLQEFFAIPRRGRQLAVLLVMLILCWFVSPFYSVISMAMAWCAFSLAVSLSGWAVLKQRRGARYVFAGLLFSVLLMLVSPQDFMESSFLFSFGAPMLGCLVALTLRMSDERAAARQAALTAARLEAELLRKQLQPHFLMNSLTALLEVVEQEPRAAVALIEALAEEFRALARMSGEKLVALGEELDLCRTHLRVMSFRLGLRHTLVTEGTRDDAWVPPAVFLTLLENGLTHQRPRPQGTDGNNVFRLRAEPLGAGAGVRYELFSPGEVQPKGTEPHHEGTGMRYVRARLDESFSGRWTLIDGPHDGGWRTVIELKTEAGK